MSDVLARAIDHALGLDREASPAAARHAARVFLVDTLAVGICGARIPEARALAPVLADGGRGEARVLCSGESLPAAQAAFRNAFQIHDQEFDCVHEGAVVHPMAVVGGVLLAVAERRGRRGAAVDGAALTDALVVAVDVAATVGLCARSPMRFFRPAMAGALGALAGAARLEGLDAGTLRRAYGLLLGQLSGTMQAHLEGTPGLPLQIGANARAAVTALDLARAGFDGPRDALEGPFGYFALVEGQFVLSPFDDLGRVFRMTEVSHKPFPTGRAAHAALDGLDRLQQAHGFGGDEVARATLEAPPLIRRLVGRPASAGMAPSWARLCLPYLVATRLVTGGVRVEDFDPPALADPARLARAAIVDWRPNGVEDPNALVPQSLEIALRSGRVLRADLPAVLGSPRYPLDRAAQRAKFDACLDASPGRFDATRRDALWAAVEALDSVPDVRELVSLCTTA
ncbi:MAG: MmgE/PrpD family protein [Pseudomonadota bacterium]